MNEFVCEKCQDYSIYYEEECRWIDYGTYSVKVITCKQCGCVHVIKYEDANGLFVNTDERYYQY